MTVTSSTFEGNTDRRLDRPKLTRWWCFVRVVGGKLTCFWCVRVRVFWERGVRHRWGLVLATH